MTTQEKDIFTESDALAVEILTLIDLPLAANSPRVVLSDVACSLALEHWHSSRTLLRNGFLSSAIAVHRAQFEALVRSIWLAYVASDTQVDKLGAELSLESEQAAKNLPQVADMLHGIAKYAPSQAYDALARFKDSSWKVLNSYTHAGIHPMRRHREGYPGRLLHDVLRNANGLAVMAGMQAAVLSGKQPLQRTLLAIAGKRPNCMPPPLNFAVTTE